MTDDCTQPGARRNRRWGAAALVAMTLVAYAPAIRCGFIWDDDYHVTKNANLRDVKGLVNIWTKFGLQNGGTPQYYPLTHTTFWIEYHLWGLRRAGYHIDNILLHAANAVMLWIVLTRLAVPGAWLAAAVFALHPVHVESVAWVTERKNVLSGAFYLAALLAYLKSAGLTAQSVNDTPPNRANYWLSLVFFIAALLSKSVTASLPAAVLLIVWWKRGRIGWRDVRPLLPMFVLGLAMSCLTSYMERTFVGAQGPEFELTAMQRVLIAGRAVWFYAWKLVWPTNLTFSYPRWTIDPSVGWQWLFPLAAVGLIVALILARRRIGRAPLVAVLYFGGTLVPALGFVNVLPMSFSFVADHFQYLASIGPIALLAAAGTMATPTPRPPARRSIGAAICIALAVITLRQQSIYANVRTLWEDTLRKNPDSWMAHHNYGRLMADDGNLEAAAYHFRETLKRRPDYVNALVDLGTTLERAGDLEGAMTQDLLAVKLDPANGVAQTNLARLFGLRGQIDEAIRHFQLAIAASPDYAPAYNNLGAALEVRGDRAGAVQAYQRAVKLDPSYERAKRNLERVRAAIR